MMSNADGSEAARRAGIIGIIAGPTASGKSALAVEIALRHDLAIISADSMQVYRGLSIGTGAIPPEEQRGVPHHLLGVVERGEEFHAARFVEEALEAGRVELAEHNRRSLVVGGTGMWIQAIREGLFEGPGRDEAVRRRLRREMAEQGREALFERLKEWDPVTAERLHPNDHVRVLRALEVQELTGRRFSDWMEEDRKRRESAGPLLPLVIIDRPREELYRRIDARVDEMLEAGWLEEARRLHALDLPSHAPARKALGYPILFEVIEGRMNLEEARELIKQETRRFAKRQLTWFRSQRKTIWVKPDVEAVERALGL